MNHKLLYASFVLLSIWVQNLSAQTILVGHRGGDISITPENTLIAITDSFSKGVGGHEIDVQLTADGKFMLMHDVQVDRTTNGTGRFSDYTSTYLKTLDAGSWKSSVYSNETIPFLSEVLTPIKNNGSRLYLDLPFVHQVAQLGNLLSLHDFAESQITFLTYYDSHTNLYVNHFPNAEVFRSLHHLSFDPNSTPSLLSKLSNIGVDGVTINKSHYSHAYVAAIHAANLKVAVVGYQSNSLAETLDYLNQGVDELWLDDLQSNISIFNNGSGKLNKRTNEQLPVSTIEVNDNSIQLVWVSIPGEQYSIEVSSDLMNWKPLHSALIATNTHQTTHTFSKPLENAQFYRVVVE